MLTEEDIEAVEIGDIIEVEPKDSADWSFIRQLCRHLRSPTYTGRVIGRGRDPDDDDSRQLYIEYACPEIDFCIFYDYDDEDDCDSDPEWGENIMRGTQYLAVGLDCISSLGVVGVVDGSVNEDNGGLSLL
jgi:hypothetical protein